MTKAHSFIYRHKGDLFFACVVAGFFLAGFHGLVRQYG